MSEQIAKENRSCGCESTAPSVSSGCCGPGPQILDIPVITKASAEGCCSPGGAVLVDTSNVTKIPRWVKGTIATQAGTVPQIATTLNKSDLLGSWKARWGIGRMDYRIPPGLYGVGAPDQNSPVLVSANYKMSFDHLRRELGDINAWILVLDTKGINVWCAAGKGTFGTEEIIRRIGMVRLDRVVKQRTLILPQLGAPGVAAHEVQSQTGFRVVYGPVRAADLPAFLSAGNRATAEMRDVRFGFMDRLVLAPMEIAGAIKPVLGLLVLLFVVNLVRNFWAPFPTLVLATLTGLLPFLGAIITGAVLTPAFLPFIPGRAFAWKGWLFGFVLTALFVLHPAALVGWKAALFYLLVLPAISSFLAMNFTGASTYTSLSGVVREMKTAVPAQIILAGLGVVFLATAVVLGI